MFSSSPAPKEALVDDAEDVRDQDEPWWQREAILL